VCRHFPRWPPPPARKSLKCSNSAIYQPIFMKFGTHNKKNMLNPKNAKPEVCRPFSKMAAPAVSKIIEML
jgi:hypothetical protein